MKRVVRKTGLSLCMLLMVVILSGCKQELYSNLSEEEANQMLALLMLRDIDTVKTMEKGGHVTISVEKSRFADAVETLRQQGLPTRRTDAITDVFPSGQLVTSPLQEQAKILYLKEQMLEKMLRSVEGVIGAQVSVAESISANRRELPVTSASVMIKHTPDVNMLEREAELRRMIQKGVANLRAENISMVMQATDYRYQRPALGPATSFSGIWSRPLTWLSALTIVLTLGLSVFGVLRWLRLKPGHHDAEH